MKHLLLKNEEDLQRQNDLISADTLALESAEELFPYQLEGASWLAERRLALLADEMGLGKTAQAIRAADLTNAESILVLCPGVARINWEREFDRFGIFKRSFDILIKGNQVLKQKNIICSYTLLESIPKDLRFDLLILDEAHYLKNHKAIRTKQVFSDKGICRRAKRVWALTGTPMPNNPSELWVMLTSFGATSLSYDRFVERYCTYYPAPFGRNAKCITGAKEWMLPELRKELTPIMLRRKKSQVMKQLPPILYAYKVVEPKLLTLADLEICFTKYFVPNNKLHELKKDLANQNNLVKQFMLTHPSAWSPKDPHQTSLKTLEALAPSIATLRRYLGIQKIDPIADIVEEALINKAYKKIVIFAVHRAVIEGLRRRLVKFKPVTLYGNTPPAQRQWNIDKFQGQPSCRVFIGNIDAAGVAITLTAASDVIFAETTYSPGSLAQAVMRVHRVGQKETVHVTFYGAAGTIDDKITHILKVKTKQISKLLDAEPELILPTYSG